MSKLLRFSGPAALVLGAACLAIFWERVPSTWTVHWGPHLVPNGWAHKSVGAAVSPLAFGFGLWGLHELLAIVTERTSKQPRLGRAIGAMLRGLGSALAIMMAGLAISLPLLPSVRPEWLGLCTLALVATLIAMSARSLRREVNALKREGMPGLEGHSGLFYRNAQDPRLWVPKLSGLGYTLNFAHRGAIPMLLVVLAPAIALFVFELVRH